MKKYVFIQPYNGINCATLFDTDKNLIDTVFAHGLTAEFNQQFNNDNFIIVTESECIELGLNIFED